MIKEVLFGIAIFAALCAAWVAPPAERRPLRAAAVTIALDWLLYCAPFHGWGFRIWLGLPYAPQPEGMVWALQDACASVAIITIWAEQPKSWLLAIWALIVFQVGLDTAYFSEGNAIWDAYSFAADVTLAIMLWIIIWKGVSGVAILVARSIDYLRNLRYQMEAASYAPRGSQRKARQKRVSRDRHPRRD